MFANTKLLAVVSAMLLLAAVITFAAPANVLAEGAENQGDGQDSESAPEDSSGPVVRVLEVRPNARSLTVGTGADVRLSVDLIGSQGASLTSEIEVVWSSEHGTLSDGSERLRSFRTPTTPGVYTVTAKVDESLCDDADDCTAIFRVVVQPTSYRESSTAEVAAPVNPSGIIPETFLDALGQAYSVVTPAEGGAYRGDGWWVTVPPGAIEDRTLLGLRMTDEGAASNAGQTEHRYTLSGRFYGLTALEDESATSSRYRLAEPSTVCVPMPRALMPRLADVALVAYEVETSLTVLGTELTRADDGGYVVCGRVSELPARLAVGVRGAPIALTDAEIASAGTEGSEALPNTGAASIGYEVARFGALAGFALAALAGIALIASRRRIR